MKASFCLIFLVAVAISANMIAARSKKSHKTEKADDALKHRVKSKKIDAEKMKLGDDIDSYWTLCKPQYANPAGVCGRGYHLTRNPEEDNEYTWAKEVHDVWDGTHTFRCPDRPYYEVRYFCSKIYTKSYWQGTAPFCGDEDEQVSDCRDAGYQGLRDHTSDFGDGNQCINHEGIKVLCAKA